MNELYTCHDCGYALLTEEAIATDRPLLLSMGVWYYGDPEVVNPVVCADEFDCYHRRRDQVAGKRALEVISRSSAGLFGGSLKD